MTNKQNKMIIVKLKGGLGNQLFQYAFGTFLSSQKNESLKLDISSLGSKNDTKREYQLNKFNIKAGISSPEELKKFKPSAWSDFLHKKILRQFHIGWEPNILQSKSTYFEGYFQSYKYLDSIRNQLLSEITLKNPIANTYQEILNKIKNTNSVAIHIRRGDFTDNQKIKLIHQTINLDYYQKAITIIKQKIANPTWYIFSDDIEWAKANLQIDQLTIFVSPPEGSDQAQELILMSKCKHQIIANSTFSWWAAYLNQNPNKIVIAPKKWNNRYQKYYQHLLPNDWITL